MGHKATGAAILVLSFWIGVLSSPAQTEPIKFNGGLQGQGIAVNRDKTGHYLTVSMALANTGKNVIYLLLLPGTPKIGPKATSGGVTYFYQSGITTGVCPSFDTLTCIGRPSVPSETPPLQLWTRVDPDTTPIVFNFQLQSNEESHGHLASFSSIFAYRVVSDPKLDDTLTDIQKREQIQTMNIGFPSWPVSEEP